MFTKVIINSYNYSMIPKDLKTSIIIPTYNRPSELKDCIHSILLQTVKPDELIIVDDGQLNEFPFKNELTTAGIKCIYFKKDKPGLTESRNEGVRLSSGDIIFFFDDDVILDSDYIEEILKIYIGNKTDRIGGVGGIQKNRNILNIKDYLLWIPEIFFMVNGFSEGRVLPSGFCIDYGTTPFRIRDNTEVDFLAGCAMSFRKRIFQDFSFDSERYLGYGLGEDKDFSYRVSRKYSFIINPKAMLLHLESTKMRGDRYTFGRKYMIDRYIFFRNHVKKSSWGWIFFYYAVFGYILIRTLIFLVSPKKENINRLRGIFDGIRYILREKKLKV